MTDDLNVDTTSGRMRGKERRGIATWRGIPYARAPRFRPPAPVEPASRDAFEFGPFALQSSDPRASTMSGVTEKTVMSEDCLVLNVYAPRTATATPGTRPVMVWIHGGAFIMGAGSQPLYDGTSFAAQHDVVVVTINYRLGVLGLLYLGDVLGDEFAEGNVALLDQIAALRWVRDNISAFGGDPARVTVMGESAGAVSVAHLLAMPAARGLFHRAILQSGALGLISRTRDEATSFARDLVTTLALATPRDLLTIPADRIIAAQLLVSATRGLGAFSPYVDGTSLPSAPLARIRDGASADIPIIIGTNRDEWMLFDVFMGPTSTQLIANQLRERLPNIEQLHDRYRDARPDRDSARAWVDLVGDMAFRIPAIQLAEAHQRHADVYMYRFDWSASPMLGAAHALELPLVWNTLDGPFAQLLLGSEIASARSLADTMHATWAAFIRDGKPDVTWPTYDLTRRATHLFDRDTRIVDDPAGDVREAWATTPITPR